jgi:hypothetical protein
LHKADNAIRGKSIARFRVGWFQMKDRSALDQALERSDWVFFGGEQACKTFFFDYSFFIGRFA